MDRIDIERADGSNGDFEVIATVDATNQGEMRWSYDFEDSEILNGIKVYRLKFVSQRDQEVYSNAINVKYVHPETLEVHPNPASDIIDILFGSLIDEGSITIYDVKGNLVRTEYFPKEGPLLNRLDITNLASGTYVYRLSNGQDVKSDKLIVYR